ncbi:RcpC/CpaB family pilus assembly protein [Streptomyces sp. NPDC093586]|uniref:RcpC/CpaB family pilus assembly protein n=1 Tax=Streptomyces sp. NPDC093586 TaxID=3366042 RepID=UPI0038037131
MSRSAVPFPQPLGADAPPTCEVPHFAPVRVRGGRHQLHRLVRHRRRAVAAGLAVTAAALVAAGPYPGGGTQDGGRARGHPVTDRARERSAARPVAAPVRIADAATVRLLAPGDRVDVVASEGDAGGGASVIARGARVLKVPDPVTGASGDGASDAGAPGVEVSDAGALVVLAVPPATAHRLVGAGARARLAVTLC